MNCQRCGGPSGRLVYCNAACRRLPRPVCARLGCTRAVKDRRRRFCGKSCAALARGIEFQHARRRGGRASWLKHGRPAYLRRLSRLAHRPDVQQATSKGEAFSRGIRHGLGLAYQHVSRFYLRARGAVPPGLLEDLQGYSRRFDQMGVTTKGVSSC